MALSNAERQARYQRRAKQRLTECVTPEDVVQAAKLMYDDFTKYELGDQPSFDEWRAKQSNKRVAAGWREMLPDTGDIAQYEDFAAKDASLLSRVGAIIAATNRPPAVDDN